MSDQSNLDQAAQDVIRAGVLLATKHALINAIQDRRLDRGHLRVLACIASMMNYRKAKAWPGLDAMSDQLGMQKKTISNLILELKKIGYLIAARESVEESGGRKLTVYTLGKIDIETIEREVTAFVNRVRDEGRISKSSENFPAHGHEISSEFPPQREDEPRKFPSEREDQATEFPPQREVEDQTSRYSGCQTSRYSGDSKAIIVKQKEDKQPTSENVKQEQSVEPKKAGKPKKSRQEGTRLPTNWFLKKTEGQWAIDNFVITSEEVRAEAEGFADYWHSVPGYRGRKSCWDLTWRNWIRNSKKKYRKRKVSSTIAPDLLDKKRLDDAEYDRELALLQKEVRGG